MCHHTPVFPGKLCTRGGTCQVGAEPSSVSTFHSSPPMEAPDGSPTSSHGRVTRTPTKHSGCTCSEHCPNPSSLKAISRLTQDFLPASPPSAGPDAGWAWKIISILWMGEMEAEGSDLPKVAQRICGRPQPRTHDPSTLSLH